MRLYEDHLEVQFLLVHLLNVLIRLRTEVQFLLVPLVECPDQIGNGQLCDFPQNNKAYNLPFEND